MMTRISAIRPNCTPRTYTSMPIFVRTFIVLLFLVPVVAMAQPASLYDTSWYTPGQTHVKIGVVEDGVYRVPFSDLQALGINLGSISGNTLRLIENGNEIPILYSGGGTPTASDHITFVGKRNTGEDEVWAYNFEPTHQSSPYHSIYSDTTQYWLTWGGANGKRYTGTSAGGGQNITARPAATHLETSAFYYGGNTTDSGNPLYTDGEAYYTYRFRHGGTTISRNYDLSIANFVDANTDTLTVSAKMQGGTASRHLLYLSAELDTDDNGSTETVPLDTADWNAYANRTLFAKIPQNQLVGTTLRVTVTSDNTFGGNPNWSYLDYVELTYNRTLTASAGQTYFDAPAAGTFAYQLAGFATPPVVLNPDREIGFTAPGTTSFGDTPAAAGEAYWLAEEGAMKTPVSLQIDIPSTLASTNNAATYVIVAGSGLISSANALAAYRSSPAGGNHQTFIADITDVFDEFDYGRPTSIAIRRFLAQTLEWATPPEYLLLWGDAIYANRSLPRSSWEVPSFGRSSSDGWFGMQLTDVEDYTEPVATGRVNIRNNADGNLFVTKISQYEATVLSDWQKNFVIMAGGTTESERATLQSHSTRWGDQAQGAPMGGDVTYYFKTEETILDVTFLDSVNTAIQRGTGWLAFFGHSAATTWEIVTKDPHDFDNAGYLPVVVSLGCFTGAFGGGNGSETDQLTFGEELVVGSLDGAIAHWGGSSSSFIGPAATLANPVYDIVLDESERSLGKLFQEGKRRYITATPNPSARTIETTLQYNLIGDPATRIDIPTQPDLHLENSSISLDPIAPSASVDTEVNVQVIVKNRGTVPTNNIMVELSHWNPGGTLALQTQTRSPFALADTVTFAVPLDEDAVGDNRYAVRVFIDGAENEVTDANNQTEKNQIVFSTGLSTIYPSVNGLVPSTQPTLRVVIAAQDAIETPVVFELDTAPTFDTGNFQTFQTTTTLAAEWTVPTPLQNGQTYYWRARVDDPTQPEDWKDADFTVDTNIAEEGWLQQGDQFKESEAGRFITYENDAWSYKTFEIGVDMSSNHSGAAFASQYIVDGVIYLRNASGFGLLTIGLDGNIMSDTQHYLYDNTVPVDPASELTAMQAAIDAVPTGGTIFLKTRFFRQASGATLLPAARTYLASLGSSDINQLDLEDLWLFVGQKTDTGVTLLQEWFEDRSVTGVNELQEFYSYVINFPESEATSPLIGPSAGWVTAGWETSHSNSISNIEVKVLSAAGNVLQSGMATSASSSGSLDLSSISSAQHPFLRLEAVFKDTSRTSTPQLDRWYVGYAPVPELVLDPASFLVSADSVQEGETIRLTNTVTNLSPQTAEGAIVTYTLTDAQNNTTTLGMDTLTVNANAPISFSLDVTTLGLAGLNTVRVSVQQPGVTEPITFNNAAFGQFFVFKDNEVPEFEFTIDGVTYPNDPRVINTTTDASLPFIPARPTIEVVLRDENPFLPLADTSLISLTLDGERLSFARPDIQFEPGTLEENEARVIFTPEFVRDTTHTIELRAEDASGNRNPTNDDPYRINFRVSPQASLTSLLSYPNPMKNFTNFAFRLLGADPSLVEDLRIQLFTISGRLIREFDLLEDPSLIDTGVLQIGWNKVPWDGTDADGDLVANGVYLYKVYFRAEGKTMAVNNKSSIEKLVVIR